MSSKVNAVEEQSCGLYKLAKNDVVVGKKLAKGSYEIYATGIECSKVLGSKGLFSKFLKLKNNQALPKPWKYLSESNGVGKFSRGNKVAFKIQRAPNPTVSETSEAKPKSSDLVFSTPSYLPNPPKNARDEYRCFLIDPNIQKESFLQSVSIQPDNLKVSHHGILYRVPAASVSSVKMIDQQTSESGWPCFGDTGIPGASAFSAASSSSWISFWAPGGKAQEFPAGTGMALAAGDQFILQSHFNVITGNSPAESMAATKVTLTLATNPVDSLKTFLLLAPIELACSPKESGPLCDRLLALQDLAARTSEKAVLQQAALLVRCGKSPVSPIASPISDCTITVREEMKIYGTTGHMHHLGRNMSITHIEAVTNKSSVIMDRPMYNFDNQSTDWQAKPLIVKAGDKLKITCVFDVEVRSKLPIYKNIPPNYVVWGEGTQDEMCLGILNYTQ